MLFGIPAGEKVPVLREVARPGIEPQGGERGDHPAAGLAHRGPLEEERSPDEVGPGPLVEAAERRRGHRQPTQRFGDEIVVGEQFVDPGQEERAEGRSEKMGVDIGDPDLVDGIPSHPDDRFAFRVHAAPPRSSPQGRRTGLRSSPRGVIRGMIRWMAPSATG